MPASKSAVGLTVTQTARERAVDLTRLSALAKERKMALYWVAVSVVLYLDTMATYFSKHLLGTVFPYSAIVLALLVFGMFFIGYPKLKLPPYGYLASYLLVMAFSVGILAVEEVELKRFRDLLAAGVVFCVGYAAFAVPRTPNLLRNAFFVIAGSYAVVCFIAVTHLYPSLFPVINAIGMRAGEWVMRPEVTTDQNFQIYYLVPITFVLALNNSALRLFAALAIAATGAYVLSELQTRSGSLVLAGTLVMASIVGMYSRAKVDYRMVAVVIIGMLGTLVFLDKIILVFQSLIERFTVSDFDTFDNRTNALLFTFRHIFDFEWWIPQGYQAYRDLTGEGKPHSNITAIYVESGLLGLIGWLLAVVIPLFLLGLRWLKRRTDPVADLALCGGAATLISQLSLNAALFQLVWFWSGAVLAALIRCEGPSANNIPDKDDGTPAPEAPIHSAAAGSAERPVREAAKSGAPLVPESQKRPLRKIDTDNLQRIDTAPRHRPDTALKRQKLSPKHPPKA